MSKIVPASDAMAGLSLALLPMEAKPVDVVPSGDGWQYEPKWDGFRCIAFEEGQAAQLQSKNQKPLGLYFPELATAIAELPSRRSCSKCNSESQVANTIWFGILLRADPADGAPSGP